MKKTLFFIRSLGAGGAERQLVVTAKGLAERGNDVTVLTLYNDGFYSEKLEGTKVSLLSLDKKGRWDMIVPLCRLFIMLRNQKPEVIYSFLGAANILTVVVRPFFSTMRVVWGVRASNMDLDKYDWLSRISYRIECLLSRFADLIIANSYAGKDYAVGNGFPESKIVVIPNGIDTEYFHPDKEAGKKLREEWGVAENEKLIGLVGRIDPMKDYPTFLKAAVLLKKQCQNVRFVCVGRGEPAYELSMRRLAMELELDDVLIWAGRQTDMLSVYNAFDISSSSSSYGEGFPNVVAEAMACGIPCVVTNVGDSALIVGEVGSVVEAKNSVMLAEAWREVIFCASMSLQGVSSVRDRIVCNFSIKKLIDSTTSSIFLDGT